MKLLQLYQCCAHKVKNNDYIRDLIDADISQDSNHIIEYLASMPALVEKIASIKMKHDFHISILILRT